MKVITSVGIDQGKRKYQQDTLYLDEDYAGGVLAIVADGIGGYGNGDDCSQLAVKYFTANFADVMLEQPTIGDAIEKTLTFTNRELKDSTLIKGWDLRSGTCFLLCYYKDGDAYFASVGDSQMFLIDSRGKTLKNTKHEFSRGVTSNLGFYGWTKTWYHKEPNIQPETAILIASDGIDYLENTGLDMFDIIKKKAKEWPAHIASDLVDATISLEHPTQDNIAAISLVIKE